jgi:transcriptional regulator
MPFDMIAMIRASRARYKRVLAMRKRGLSYVEIAEKLGVSRQRATELCRSAEKYAKRR